MCDFLRDMGATGDEKSVDAGGLEASSFFARFLGCGAVGSLLPLPTGTGSINLLCP